MKTENRSLCGFPLFVYHLLIIQTKVCHVSVCWRRNKWKSSICKWIKWTKQTKQACQSVHTSNFDQRQRMINAVCDKNHCAKPKRFV